MTERAGRDFKKEIPNDYYLLRKKHEERLIMTGSILGCSTRESEGKYHSERGGEGGFSPIQL